VLFAVSALILAATMPLALDSTFPWHHR